MEQTGKIHREVGIELPGIRRALAVVTEVPAAILVVVEIVILASSVVARYILNAPFRWSDELAITLFIWLSMLGSVIAIHRHHHMRLSFVANRIREPWKGRIDTLAAVLMIAFLAVIFAPSIDYTALQLSERTPALHMPGIVQGGAFVVGAALMMIALTIAILERSSARDIAFAVAVAACLTLLLWAGKPLYAPIGNYNLVIFFVVLVLACVVVGVPIAFAFGVGTFFYLSLVTTVPLSVVMNQMYSGMSDIILLSIPLFIFLGALMELTGLARVLIVFLELILGGVRNGLSYVLLGSMYLVSGISGSKAADMAAIVPVLFPEMKRRGADEGELVSLLAASGAMAETIPPSIILISIGVITGVSISSLFTGGLMPALIGAIALAAVVFFRSRDEDVSLRTKPTAVQILRAFVVAVPALVLPLVIRAAVVDGVATATEVATIGIVYCAICGIAIYRSFPFERIYPALVTTASLSGAIMFIIGMATAMGWSLTQAGFADQLASVMTHIPGGSGGFMAVSIVLFALLGSVLEGFPAIVLFGPLLFPIARNLGINEVQYTMVAVLSMSLGLFAPPVGIGFYSACAVSGVSPDKGVKHIWIYLGALALAVVLVATVPWISTGFLPHTGS